MAIGQHLPVAGGSDHVVPLHPLLHGVPLGCPGGTVLILAEKRGDVNRHAFDEFEHLLPAEPVVRAAVRRRGRQGLARTEVGEEGQGVESGDPEAMTDRRRHRRLDGDILAEGQTFHQAMEIMTDPARHDPAGQHPREHPENVPETARWQFGKIYGHNSAFNTEVADCADSTANTCSL